MYSNIVIVGNRDLSIEQVREALKTLDQEKFDEGKVTKFHNSDCRKVKNNRQSTYLIVRTTDRTQGRVVATHLRDELDIDVEIELIEESLSRKKRKKKKK